MEKHTLKAIKTLLQVIKADENEWGEKAHAHRFELIFCMLISFHLSDRKYNRKKKT